MLWLVLFGTFLSAGNSIVDKKVLNGKAIHPFACATSFGMVGLPIALAGLLLLPAPAWPQACLSLVAGIIYIPAAWLYYDTLTREDVSCVVPILRLSTLQTVLFGVLFLGEVLTLWQWFACLLLLLSSVLLSCKSGPHGLTYNRAALRLLPATMLLALSSTLMAMVYRSTPVWNGFVWNSAGMVVSVALLNLVRVRHTFCWLSTVNRKTWAVLLGEQIIRNITQGITALALTHGVPIALTSTLSSASLIWVWLLAIIFLKERTSSSDMLIKSSGIIGMCLGVYLLL